MTRTQRLLYRRRHTLWIVTALLFLGGAVAVAFLQIDRAQSRGDQLAAEANRRGNAVTTLATDVRTLRSQIQSKGGTPAAPDPTAAVKNLPDRAEVPVPIPGPRGPKGDTGSPGAAAPTITPSPGAPGANGQTGANGQAGATSTVPGPAGPAGPQGPVGQQGADGKDGSDGTNGSNGQACPTGYSWQAPANDPDALVCRKDGAPAPSPPAGQSLLGMGATDPRRPYT